MSLTEERKKLTEITLNIKTRFSKKKIQTLSIHMYKCKSSWVDLEKYSAKLKKNNTMEISCIFIQNCFNAVKHKFLTFF